MNIAVFSTDYRPRMGGIATLTEEIARRISKSHDVTVIAPLIAGFKRFDSNNQYKTVRVLNVWFIRELIFAALIAFLIIFRNYKKVYCLVWFPCGLICYFLSFAFNFEYYCAGFGSDYIDDTKTLKRRVKYLLAGWKIKTFNKAKKVLTCSPYSRDKLVEMGVRADNIEVVAPGVDVNVFKPGRPSADFIDRYKISGRRILLTVARFEAYKGQDTIISILPSLLNRYPDLYYYMVGDGEDRKRLEKLAGDTGVSANVVFTGFVEPAELVEFYRAAEIFIMVSRQIDALVEGFGITFLEAASCAKPVVAGVSGGTTFAVKNGVSGILVDPLNKAAILEAIDKFLANREYAQNFGIDARRWVVEERTWDSSAQQTLKIITNQ